MKRGPSTMSPFLIIQWVRNQAKQLSRNQMMFSSLLVLHFHHGPNAMQANCSIFFTRLCLIMQWEQAKQKGLDRVGRPQRWPDRSDVCLLSRGEESRHEDHQSVSPNYTFCEISRWYKGCVTLAPTSNLKPMLYLTLNLT